MRAPSGRDMHCEHKAPTPAPIEEPLPEDREHPVPVEEPVPDHNPSLVH